MRKMMQIVLVVIGILSVYCFGCSTPAMVVPADIASMPSDEIVAVDRKKASGALVNEAFKLGPYEITDVDRDWNSTKSMGINSFSAEKSTGGYSYTLKTEQGSAKGACFIEGEKQGVSLMAGLKMSQSASKFGCACDFGGDKTEAVLNAKNDSDFAGTVTTRANEYTISSISNVEKSFSNGNPSGYRVDSDGPVAATDVTHPGKVWLSKELSAQERDDLSCIFSGLMLYQGTKK